MTLSSILVIRPDPVSWMKGEITVGKNLLGIPTIYSVGLLSHCIEATAVA
jgi:hypothetical protein